MTIHESARQQEMTDLMKQHELRHLLVVDAAGKLVGIVSDRDVKGSCGDTAKQIMSPPSVTCEPEASLRVAVTKFFDSRVSSLPVLDQGRLVGIFTVTDAAMALQCSLQLIRRLSGDRTLDIEGISPPTEDDGDDLLTDDAAELNRLEAVPG